MPGKFCLLLGLRMRWERKTGEGFGGEEREECWDIIQIFHKESYNGPEVFLIEEMGTQ